MFCSLLLEGLQLPVEMQRENGSTSSVLTLSTLKTVVPFCFPSNTTLNSTTTGLSETDSE